MNDSYLRGSRVVGLDISLNHYGLVCIDNLSGKLIDYHFLTDTKKYANADYAHSTYYQAPSARYDHTLHFRRIGKYIRDIDITFHSWIDWAHAIPDDEVEYTGIAIEGYVTDTRNTRLYEGAEIVGSIKADLLQSTSRFLRVHDPDSVKLFATGHGNATKAQVYAKFVEETGCVVPLKESRSGKGDIEGPGTDVADAYFLARLLWTELQLRAGYIRLQDLPEHHVRVFNRVTKAYPVNLLDRPFASFSDEVPNGNA